MSATPFSSYPDTEEREALRRLYNEVAGCWSAFQYELREAISNTNYAVVQHKLDAAKAILDFPAPPSVPTQDPVDRYDETMAAIDVARAALSHPGPVAQGSGDCGVLMNVLNAKINDYVELHNRGDLTEVGEHAWVAMTNLRRDMEFEIKRRTPEVTSTTGGGVA